MRHYGTTIKLVPEWQPADDDFLNKWLHVYDHVTTTRVVSNDHVTTTRVISYDHVTTTGVVSYDHVTTTRVVSDDHVTTARVVSYDPVTTSLSSVKEVTDDSDDPTDDKWRPEYVRVIEVTTLAKIIR